MDFVQKFIFNFFFLNLKLINILKKTILTLDTSVVT